MCCLKSVQNTHTYMHGLTTHAHDTCAVFGVDFTLGDVILSFSDNNNPRCFPVTIIRDNDQNEQQESFTVELSLFGNPENVELVRSVATISIDDIDDIDVGCKCVCSSYDSLYCIMMPAL